MIALLRTNQPRKAIADGERFIAQVGPHGPTYGMIGMAYEELDQIPLAIIAFRQALAEEPDNANYREAIARLDPVTGKRTAPPRAPNPPTAPAPAAPPSPWSTDFRL
jgi:hypothetical protein